MGIILKEGRKEDLKKKYSTKFNEEDLDYILNISDLQDFNHKYTDFVLKFTDGDGELDTDELEKTVELVKDFDKYQSQLPKKDINQYVSLNELEKVIVYLRNKAKDKEEEKKVDKIYEDDKFLILKPQSEAASCKYGSNTKWCVTSRGSGHFGRYTSGRQQLYFIINKTNSTNKNYSKIAIHFDDGGEPRYWDSEDNLMSQRESDIINYAYPELIEAINSDYKKLSESLSDRFLTQIFDSVGETSAESRNFLKSIYNLSTLVRGFQNIPDLGFGRAEGVLTISLNSDEENKLIDEYQIFISYKSKDERTFTVSIGFASVYEVSSDDYVDLGLEGWGLDLNYPFEKDSAQTAERIRIYIARKVEYHIKDNPRLIRKLVGTTKVFTPTYGYTFSKNKGWVKKLVNFLDSGKIGTKLDFLIDVGYLEKITQDGKTKFRKTNGNHLYNQRDLRGQFASFFAAAKNAGILSYRKIGKDFLLIKGPNFEAFKSGELKAL